MLQARTDASTVLLLHDALTVRHELPVTSLRVAKLAISYKKDHLCDVVVVSQCGGGLKRLKEEVTKGPALGSAVPW